jgi:CDGSH-type Zn-finger protein
VSHDSETADELETAEERWSGPGVSITVCPDGPLLVRGPVELVSADGETVEHPRRVVALCRCGRSRLKPLCDGSHRLSRFRDPATGDQISHVLNRARPAPTE